MLISTSQAVVGVNAMPVKHLTHTKGSVNHNLHCYCYNTNHYYRKRVCHCSDSHTFGNGWASAQDKLHTALRTASGLMGSIFTVITLMLWWLTDLLGYLVKMQVSGFRLQSF